MSSTYSFKSVSGSFSHPLAGTFAFSGQIGMGQFTVVMSSERSAHNVAADGAVMVSYMAGDNGTIAIQMQQTGDFYDFLQEWFNVCKTAADAGDPTNWASASLTLVSITDGVQHICTGVSPGKPGDKPYAAQGQDITWTLFCADIQNIVPGA